MSDQLTETYADLIEGSYDCPDRIVLNAYFGMGHSPGGFRSWWRRLYGTDEDLDKARRVVMEAVRQVTYVLPDKPVDALFRDFGQSTIEFRVRWWTDAKVDIYKMYDEINDAILNAFRDAGIEVAVPKQDLKFKVEGDDASPLASASIEKR